ncbi:hypothetical protein HOH87_03765 [bacterium]|jgi:hypothetical protein|nr:hypothetical protein [bacterium]
MTKKKLLALTLIAILSIPTISFAENWVDELDLSREQIHEIRDQKKKSSKLRRHLVSQKTEKKQSIREELLKDTPDEIKIADLKNSVALINERLMDTQIDDLKKTRDLLNEKQVNKLKKRRRKSKLAHKLSKKLNKLDQKLTRKHHRSGPNTSLINRKSMKHRRDFDRHRSKLHERIRNKDRIKRQIDSRLDELNNLLDNLND